MIGRRVDPRVQPAGPVRPRRRAPEEQHHRRCCRQPHHGARTALALAVRSGAPIFAAEEVIAESAIEFEHDVEDTEEVVDRFKEFLDEVSPEDFAGGEDS